MKSMLHKLSECPPGLISSVTLLGDTEPKAPVAPQPLILTPVGVDSLPGREYISVSGKHGARKPRLQCSLTEFLHAVIFPTGGVHDGSPT